MHKWDKKWNNEPSDGTREDIIERQCIHCDIQQRVIYSKGNKYARVVTFDMAGKVATTLPACKVSDVDEEDNGPKNPRGPNIRTRRKLESTEITTAILRKVPTAKVVDVPQGPQNSVAAPVQSALTVNLVVVNADQLAALISEGVRTELSKIFKIA